MLQAGKQTFGAISVTCSKSTILITRAVFETNSKLTIKKPERRRSGVFIVNLEQISHIVLVIPSMTLNK